LDIAETDDQAEEKAHHHGGHPMRTDTGRRACQAEIVSEGGPGDHSKNEHPGVSVPLTGHEQLAPRAPSRQGEGKTGNEHASEVPEAQSIGHGLFFEAGMKLAQDQVGQQSSRQQGQKAGKGDAIA